MSSLDSTNIVAIARSLGLESDRAPADAILQYCEERAEQILAGYPECTTPAELLEHIAAALGTVFEVVESDEHIREVQTKYAAQGELAFASLDQELDDGTFGITIRRKTAGRWEPQLVSVIDARGAKGSRRYFTKWHEIGHLLILSDSLRGSFERTSHGGAKDPEEVLVDQIAGHLGYYSRFLLPQIGAAPSLADLERVRSRMVPEASFHSFVMAYVERHPSPCLLLEATLAEKEDQRALEQSLFDFVEPPPPKLHVVRSTGSATARSAKLAIPRKFPVPERSVIHKAHILELDALDAVECLSWWESQGKSLPECPVRVEVRRNAESLFALMRTL